MLACIKQLTIKKPCLLRPFALQSKAKQGCASDPSLSYQRSRQNLPLLALLPQRGIEAGGGALSQGSKRPKGKRLRTPSRSACGVRQPPFYLGLTTSRSAKRPFGERSSPSLRSSPFVASQRRSQKHRSCYAFHPVLACPLVLRRKRKGMGKARGCFYPASGGASFFPFGDGKQARDEMEPLPCFLCLAKQGKAKV